MHVRVNIVPYGGRGKYMNVYLDAPSDDFGNTEGVCGMLDGKKDATLVGHFGHNYAMKNATQAQNHAYSWL